MRTPKATKASSTCGIGDEVRAALTPEEYRGIRAALRARSRAELRRQVAPARVPLIGAAWPLKRKWMPTRPNERLNSARAKLLAMRNRRVWPGRDEKILTSWNALTIRGMAVRGSRARAGRSRGVRHARARLHSQDAVARRAPARHVQGRARAPECLSRRLRVSRRCDPRAAAGALPAGRARLRARAARGGAGAFPR